MKKQMRGNVLLLITAFVWGMGFVAQSEGMNYVGPYTFLATRSLLAGCVLLVFLGIRSGIMKKKNRDAATQIRKVPEKGKLLLSGGLCCGVVLFTASMLQQVGILYAPESGKAGFLTALYIILVPIFGIFLKKKVGKRVWLAVVLAAAGMYILCVKNGMHLEKGDFLLFLCAIGYTVHIMVVDHFSPKLDGVWLACLQFFVCGILGTVGMFLFETPTAAQILGAWLPILYAGGCSSGIGYTLQIVGQKDTDPTVASLLMSLESVFALLGGWVILGQVMSARELLGCLLMFAGIILAQLPEKKERNAG